MNESGRFVAPITNCVLGCNFLHYHQKMYYYFILLNAINILLYFNKLESIDFTPKFDLSSFLFLFFNLNCNSNKQQNRGQIHLAIQLVLILNRHSVLLLLLFFFYIGFFFFFFLLFDCVLLL